MKKEPRFLVTILSVLILFPVLVSFAHVISSHEHEVCNHYSERHFHEGTLDCQFLKYNKTQYPNVEIATYTFLPPQNETAPNPFFYGFLSEFKPLGFALRGPPFTV